MSGFVGPLALANTGSTGNNTHNSVSCSPAANKTSLIFIVEAVGATPTVTFKFQGTLDPNSVTDANAQWADLALLPIGSETVTAAPTAVTAVGNSIFYIAQSHTRFVRRVRVITSANTNVTYSAQLHQQYAN